MKNIARIRISVYCTKKFWLQTVKSLLYSYLTVLQLDVLMMFGHFACTDSRSGALVVSDTLFRVRKHDGCASCNRSPGLWTVASYMEHKARAHNEVCHYYIVRTICVVTIRPDLVLTRVLNVRLQCSTVFVFSGKHTTMHVALLRISWRLASNQYQWTSTIKSDVFLWSASSKKVILIFLLSRLGPDINCWIQGKNWQINVKRLHNGYFPDSRFAMILHISRSTVKWTHDIATTYLNFLIGR